MALSYIKLHYDWSRTTSALTADEKGRLIDAMVAYASGQPYELSGSERFVFPAFCAQIDRDKAAYADISAKRRRAIESRWEQKNTNVYTCMQEKEKEEDKEKDKEYEKEGVIGGKVQRKRFTPPTLSEIERYITEQGYSVDAQRFLDYYTANGWKVGRNPMKDWRAAVRTWVSSESKQTPSASKQNYTQHEYRDEDFENGFYYDLGS